MTTIICPVCAMRHERSFDYRSGRGNTRTIFCQCGSAAQWVGWWGGWYWFRRSRPERIETGTQTEKMQAHGPEIDL